MHWKELEKIIHDNHDDISKQDAEEFSQKLLASIAEDTQPLQAAKAAYALILLQLKQKQPQKEKALQFVKHLRTILKHEISETEISRAKNAQAHLVYVRKLAEQYFHHLMVIAEIKDAKKVLKALHTLRKSNHMKLLKLQKTTHSFWHHEQKLIKDSLKHHYLFVGFLFSIALYFAWTSFWSLADTVFSHWIYSEYSAISLTQTIQNVLLLLFSLSFIKGFISYQGAVQREEE